MENLLMYILLSAMMVMIPGADFILITKNTLSLGTKAGHMTMLGTVAGLAIWTVVAVFGLAAIVAQSTFLFNIIKYLGAAYLVFIGIKSIKTKGTISIEMDDSKSELTLDNAPREQYKKCFLQGFLSNVLNPKTVIVYVTLMPQFIDTNQNVYLQLIILASILIMVLILWFLIVIQILNHIRAWFKKTKVQNIFNKATGTLLVSLAVKLALEKN